MRFPYQRLHVCGNVLVAARGGSIDTFSISEGTYISTWKHKHAPFRDAARELEAGHAGGEPSPAAKRRRVDDDDDDDDGADPQGSLPASSKEPGRQRPKKGPMNNTGAVQEDLIDPVVTVLEGTADGRYVVAVTGQDKTVRVLEHDGRGVLRQLSERYGIHARRAYKTGGPRLLDATTRFTDASSAA